MGSVIFILLVATVFAWLYSLRKGWRRNRRNTLSAGSRADETEVSDAADMPAETSLEKPAGDAESQYVYVEKKPREKRIRPEKPDVHVPRSKERRETEPKDVSPEKSWAEQLNLTDVDSAKKAFIASELLNRKY